MGAHSIQHYTRIYGILCGLFAISFAGPLLSDMFLSHDSWVRFGIVMTTAFVVAVIKAWLVAKHFMHLTIEPRFIHYMVVTGLVFMLMFVAGTSVDIMNHDGSRWENTGAKMEIERALAAGPTGHHEGGHDDGHGGHDAAPADGHGDAQHEAGGH